MRDRQLVAWLVFGVVSLQARAAESFPPHVPKTWDDAAMSTLEIPLAHPEFSPKHAPAGLYYRLPVRPIYESYPVYHPDHEPPGYLDSLRRREPRIAWDPAKLYTREDWIRAGELVFEAPIGYGGIGMGEGHSQTLYCAAGRGMRE